MAANPIDSEDAACAHFVDKWQQREPEMQFAELFCDRAERGRFRAWGALLYQLRESLFELSDPQITAVKTGWWAEEMIGVGQGRQRHPLTAVLVGTDAPWAALGRALLEADTGQARASDIDQAIGLLLPTASAVLAVESAIFDAANSPDAQRSLALHWLLQRLPRGLASDDQARIPMHLFARHGLTAAQLAVGEADALLRDWGRELGQAMPARLPGASLIRRSQLSFDRASARRQAAGKEAKGNAPPLTIWRAWRAARSS